MNDIIKWCNENEGFLTAILSIATLFVSIIAIVISICTSRLPYKKKLLLTIGSFIGVGIDSIGIHVTATNIGNRNVRIKNIGLLINKKVYTNIKTVADSQIVLSTGDSTTQYFDNNELKNIKENIGFKVYGFIEDTEGKKYKKYICKLRKLI